MSTVLTRRRPTTVADLIESLGDIPLARVCLDPPPGQATEDDLLRLLAAKRGQFELVHGTLVEKAMGVKESFLAAWIIFRLQEYLQGNDLGGVTGPDGTLKLQEHLVRIPDVGFLLWENVPPDDELPPIPELAPDLAVEVISPSNTAKEMAKKRREYFRAGTRLVWHVYPLRKEVEVYTSPARFRTLGLADSLDGGDLLPGFQLPLTDLFAERGATKRRTGQRKSKS
jgi:Uma2 family endonuclease